MGNIIFRNLSFSYFGDMENSVVKDINFTIDEGEFVCIIGPSGSGKTTLLMLLAGLYEPTAGEIVINDEIVTEPSTDRAVVFQHYSLFPWMTAYKNVVFGIEQSKKKRGKVAVAEAARESMVKVGMWEDRYKYPSQLSGGMQQRVAIARAIAMEPSILLLDEPFGALDARRRAELQHLLENLCCNEGQKKTVVFITHDIDEAILLADRIVCMSDGKVSEVLEVPFERKRNYAEIRANERFAEIRRRIYGILRKSTTGAEEYEEEDI